MFFSLIFQTINRLGGGIRWKCIIRTVVYFVRWIGCSSHPIKYSVLNCSVVFYMYVTLRGSWDKPPEVYLKCQRNAFVTLQENRRRICMNSILTWVCWNNMCFYSLFFTRALALTPSMTRRNTLDEVSTTGRKFCLCWKLLKRRGVFLNLLILSLNTSIA